MCAYHDWSLSSGSIWPKGSSNVPANVRHANCAGQCQLQLQQQLFPVRTVLFPVLLCGLEGQLWVEVFFVFGVLCIFNVCLLSLCRSLLFFSLSTSHYLPFPLSVYLCLSAPLSVCRLYCLLGRVAAMLTLVA